MKVYPLKKRKILPSNASKWYYELRLTPSFMFNFGISKCNDHLFTLDACFPLFSLQFFFVELHFLQLCGLWAAKLVIYNHEMLNS